MRSARRAADAARRRKPSFSSDDEASSRRASRGSFGSDYSPAPPVNRPQVSGRQKPMRRASLDDIPEQQHHQPQPIAPPCAESQRRRFRSLGDLPSAPSTTMWPPNPAAAVIVPRCSSGSSSRGEPRPSYDDDTDDMTDDQPALTSPAAAKLRAKLGDRAFFAVCGMFRDAYDRGSSVSRHDLLGVVGTQDRYLDCFKVERLVYADYVAGHYYCEAG